MRSHGRYRRFRRGGGGRFGRADANLTAGDTVRSDFTNLYNIAGAYPILLKVSGVLGPNGTPDDHAFLPM